MKKILFAIAGLFFLPSISFAASFEWYDALIDENNTYYIETTGTTSIKYATGTAAIGYGDIYYYSTTSSSLSDEILASLYPLMGTSSPWTHQTNGNINEPLNLSTSYGNCADSIQVELFVETAWPSNIASGKYQMVVCDHGEWSIMYDYINPYIEPFNETNSPRVQIISPDPYTTVETGGTISLDVQYSTVVQMLGDVQISGPFTWRFSIYRACATNTPDNLVLDQEYVDVTTWGMNVNVEDVYSYDASALEDASLAVEACLVWYGTGGEYCDVVHYQIGDGDFSCTGDTWYNAPIRWMWDQLIYKAPWGYVLIFKETLDSIVDEPANQTNIVLPLGDMNMPISDLGNFTLFQWSWITDSELYDTYLDVDQYIQYFIQIGLMLYFVRRIIKYVPSLTSDATAEYNRGVKEIERKRYEKAEFHSKQYRS